MPKEQTFAEKVVEAMEVITLDIELSDADDEGPMYEKMVTRESFDRLLAVLSKAIEQRDYWMNAVYDDMGLIIHEKAPEANAELLAVAKGDT